MRKPPPSRAQHFFNHNTFLVKAVGLLTSMCAVFGFYHVFIDPVFPDEMTDTGMCIGATPPITPTRCWVGGEDDLLYFEGTRSSAPVGSLMRIDAQFYEDVPLHNERMAYIGALLACHKTAVATAQQLGVPASIARPEERFIACQGTSRIKYFPYIRLTYEGDERDYPVYENRSWGVYDRRSPSWVMREYKGGFKPIVGHITTPPPVSAFIDSAQVDLPASVLKHFHAPTKHLSAYQEEKH